MIKHEVRVKQPMPLWIQNAANDIKSALLDFLHQDPEMDAWVPKIRQNFNTEFVATIIANRFNAQLEENLKEQLESVVEALNAMAESFRDIRENGIPTRKVY